MTNSFAIAYRWVATLLGNVDRVSSGPGEDALYGNEADPIDVRILPLVSAMRGTGRIRTTGSCEGHPLFYCPPYVSFVASPNDARQIELALRKSARLPGGLSTEWAISASFDREGNLEFRLHCPIRDEMARSLMGSLTHFGLRRRILDIDFQLLCALVSDAIKVEQSDD